MKLNKKTATTLFVILIIVALLFMILVAYYMISYKEEFTSNPFIYGARKMNLGECYCSCYDDYNANPITFYFNQSSFLQS
jgi:hypothetical protein